MRTRRINRGLSKLDYLHKPKLQAVCVLVYHPESDTFLIVKNTKASHRKGAWSLPGGGLKKNETIYNGALRELFEETNYASWENMEYWSHWDNNDWKTRIYFFITKSQPLLYGENAEITQWKWVNINNLNDIVMEQYFSVDIPYIEKWINRYKLFGNREGWKQCNKP